MIPTGIMKVRSVIYLRIVYAVSSFAGMNEDMRVKISIAHHDQTLSDMH